MEVAELLEYVNNGLGKGSSLVDIAKQLGKNESTLRKRLNKSGYRRVGQKFVIDMNTTSSTTGVEVIKIKENHPNTTSSTTKEIKKIDDTIDMDKLKILLDNVDNLLRLIPNTTSSTTNISLDTDHTKVTSLRINEAIYNLVKSRATRDNCTIGDIVNKSLMDYLNNYL